MAFRFIACTIKMACRKHAVGTKTKLSEYIQLGSLGHVHNHSKQVNTPDRIHQGLTAITQ